MKKLCYLLSAALLLSTAGKEIRAQQRIIEDNADFSLRIQLHKLEADEKKDKYLMEISLANKRNYDLYYAVAKNSNVSYMNTSMGTIKVQNATGLMKSTGFSGALTRLETINNEALVVIEKQETLQGQFKFSVPGGTEPLVTFTGNTVFRKLESFPLRLNAIIVNGTWNSACLSAASTLSYIDTGAVHYMLQGLNGRYIKWLKQTENTFVRSESQGTTLTYSLATGQFTYTNTDGVFCVWRKEE